MCMLYNLKLEFQCKFSIFKEGKFSKLTKRLDFLKNVWLNDWKVKKIDKNPLKSTNFTD